MVTYTAIADRANKARRAEGAEVPIATLATNTGIPRATLTRFFAGKGDLKTAHLITLAHELKADASSWVADLPQVAA